MPLTIGILIICSFHNRSDLKRAWDLIKSGASSKDLFEELPSVAFKYQRGIAAAKEALIEKRDGSVKPVLEIFWGPSGTGKTKKAMSENPGAYVLNKSRDGNSCWWGGYNGQKTVIIDEFYGWLKYDDLLRLVDRYEYQVEYKGGQIQIAATKFVITSNKPWEEWYSEEMRERTNNFEALRRRIREFGTITHMIGMEAGEGGQVHFA